MREILFRGKRLGDGEWVDGSLFIDDKGEKHEILIGYVNYRVSWEVDPETVGQFTGLTDKNGERIFEGDIVRYTETHCTGDMICTDSVSFIDGGFYPIPSEFSCGDSYYSYELHSFEVIGNIHDNPELLKSE